MTALRDFPRACSDFMPRVRSDVCHLCLQPRSAHPDDDDAWYWYEWLRMQLLLELL